jgi:hypothetical protein
MVIVLQDYTTEEQSPFVRLFVGKKTLCKDIHKEMFPAWGCLSRKAVQH